MLGSIAGVCSRFWRFISRSLTSFDSHPDFCCFTSHDCLNHHIWRSKARLILAFWNQVYLLSLLASTSSRTTNSIVFRKQSKASKVVAIPILCVFPSSTFSPPFLQPHPGHQNRWQLIPRRAPGSPLGLAPVWLPASRGAAVDGAAAAAGAAVFVADASRRGTGLGCVNKDTETMCFSKNTGTFMFLWKSP